MKQLNKLWQFKRLNMGLSIKLFFIYLKRLFRIKLSEAEVGYISYLFTLQSCNLFHISEEKDIFQAVTKDGVHLYLRKYPSSDSTVLHQIWIDKEYQIIIDFIKEKFHQAEICIVDAGANVGYSSLYLFYHLKDQFKVKFIIIEPGPDNVKILKRNFAANNLKNYSIEEAGLYNKSCYLNIKRDFRDGRDWSLSVEESKDVTDLKSVELQSLLNKYEWKEIDFCKIDIEGAEEFIFKDKLYADSFLKNIRLISIEIHDEKNIRQNILNSLEDNNFQLSSHGELTIGYVTRN